MILAGVTTGIVQARRTGTSAGPCDLASHAEHGYPEQDDAILHSFYRKQGRPSPA